MFNYNFIGGGAWVPSAPLPISLVDGDASPSVASENGYRVPIYRTANTVLTTILSWDDAVAGNYFIIQIGDDFTIIGLSGLLYYPKTGDWLEVYFDGTSYYVQLHDVNNPLANITPGQAGENLAAYDLCYLKSDGKYWKSDANAAVTMPGVALAAQILLADAWGSFITEGRVTNAGWAWGTVGGLLYASGTAGGMTLTAPAVSGDQVQIVGQAVAATIIDFKPERILIEVA